MTRKMACSAGESVPSMDRTEYRTPARLSCCECPAFAAEAGGLVRTTGPCSRALRSEPDGRLAGPLALGVVRLQLLGRRLERRRVVRRLVGRNTRPVAAFRRGAALAVRLADRPEALLGVAKCAVLEGNLGEPHFELREEVVHRKESLHPVPLG